MENGLGRKEGAGKISPAAYGRTATAGVADGKSPSATGVALLGFAKPYGPADPLMRIAVGGGAAAVFLRLVEQIDLALQQLVAQLLLVEFKLNLAL